MSLLAAVTLHAADPAPTDAPPGAGVTEVRLGAGRVTATGGAAAASVSVARLATERTQILTSDGDGSPNTGTTGSTTN